MFATVIDLRAKAARESLRESRIVPRLVRLENLRQLSQYQARAPRHNEREEDGRPAIYAERLEIYGVEQRAAMRRKIPTMIVFMSHLNSLSGLSAS